MGIGFVSDWSGKSQNRLNMSNPSLNGRCHRMPLGEMGNDTCSSVSR